jgi:hypothetical protein
VPAIAVALQERRALGQPPRHGEDQRHGHVGGILGEDARRVGDQDRAVPRRLEIDIVDAGAELGDQLEVGAGLAQHPPVDAVGDGRHQHVGGFGGVDQLLARERLVVEIELCVEKLPKTRLHHVRELARDNNDGSFSHDRSS